MSRVWRRPKHRRKRWYFSDMIQDIWPRHLYNEYRNIKPEENDTILYFQGMSVLAQAMEDGKVVCYPQYGQFIQGINAAYGAEYIDNLEFIYLLSLDDRRFFLARERGSLERGQFFGEYADSGIHAELDSFLDGYAYIGVNLFRNAEPRDVAYAAITAFHLYGWYRDNSFCGRCGKLMRHDDKQRMMRCDSCGNMVFPKISPAVIVAVTDGDRLLLTKYAGRTYKNYALIAGFTEIGETMEETVRREVMEEVGVKVKNITYYKSQPWGLSGSELMGYFCELDGDGAITLEEDELSVGEWVKAADIDVQDDHVSLTREMIEKFRREHCTNNS